MSNPRRAPLVPIMLAVGLMGLMAVSALTSASEVDPQVEHLARAQRLMEVSGSTEMGLQMATLLSAQLFAAMQQADPTLPEGVHDVIAQIANDLVQERSGDLFSQLAPLYAKNFSIPELDEMIRFYESPTGKKVVRVMPALMQESFMISQAWGANLQPELLTRLEEELGPLDLE